jgi:hypothetical protein
VAGRQEAVAPLKGVILEWEVQGTGVLEPFVAADETKLEELRRYSRRVVGNSCLTGLWRFALARKLSQPGRRGRRTQSFTRTTADRDTYRPGACVPREGVFFDLEKIVSPVPIYPFGSF